MRHMPELMVNTTPDLLLKLSLLIETSLTAYVINNKKRLKLVHYKVSNHV